MTLYKWEVSAGMDDIELRMLIHGMCRVDEVLEPEEIAALVEGVARREVADKGFNVIEDFHIVEAIDVEFEE